MRQLNSILTYRILNHAFDVVVVGCSIDSVLFLIVMINRTPDYRWEERKAPYFSPLITLL